jgi:hypothetical protein
MVTIVKEGLLISDKIDIQSKIFIREKDYYLMIEDSIHKENKTIINTYAYIKAPKYIE